MLDRIGFADSLLSIGNHFVLNTEAMSPVDLNTYGLEAADSLASDHLMHVADFR